jgi:SNARE protein
MQIILLYFHINLMSRVLNNLKILQTDQMGRVVNHLDTIQFSIKKASQLVKEIGRQVCNLIWTYVDLSFLAWPQNLNAYVYLFQVATDKCIMGFLFLIVCGVVAIIIVKVLSFLSLLKVVIAH